MFLSILTLRKTPIIKYSILYLVNVQWRPLDMGDSLLNIIFLSNNKYRDLGFN